MWRDKNNRVQQVILEYFQTIFKSTNPNPKPFLSGIQPQITSDHMNLLLAPYGEEEFKSALFFMHSDKFPGLDGMNAAFYQHHWDIVKRDLVAMCLKVIRERSMSPKFHQTCIVLIPKKQVPETVSDLRPIALCNVAYKIVAKMIANHLKMLLPDIISVNQSAFIPNRLITNNIIVAYEMLHYLKRKKKGKHGLAALKVDISKAYNRMEWGYLEKVMEKYGFSPKFMEIIMMCVKSVNYHVMVGGDLLGLIQPQRGLC